MAYGTTPFHGKTARIEKNNTAVAFTGGYTWNASVDMADTSSQGDSWKTAIPGMGSWGGSFDGQFVMGNTEQAAFVSNIVTATPGTLLTDVKFLLDASTNAFSGDIYITNVTVTANTGDKCTCSFTVQGNGAPAISDAA